MEFLVDKHLIRIRDASYIKVRNSSVFAIYVVLALEQLNESDAKLSALDISKKLKGAVSPETISRILWEESEYKKMEGILFVRFKSENHQDIIRKGQKPETGRKVRQITYRLASQHITSSPSQLNDWLEDFIKKKRLEGYRDITSSRASDLTRLHSLYTAGKFKEAFLLYGSHELKNIGRSLSGKARQKLLVRRDRLFGSMLMARGDFKKAIHLLSQSMIRGQRVGEVYEVAQAAGNLAAAFRMKGIGEVATARAVCEDAVQYVQKARRSLEETEYGSLLRWLFATLSLDFTLYENYGRAFDSTDEALDVVDLAGEDRYLGETEIRFRRARVYLLKSDIDSCEEELEKIERLLSLPMVARVDWVSKWMPRWKADLLLAQKRTEEAKIYLLQGWKLNLNYGFQRACIAQRMLALNYIDPSMTTGIEKLHKQFLGSFTADCKYCSGKALIDRLRCVFNQTWPSVPPSFWF
jgi:tetratricopeptide (TPR) repeat protein